MSSQVASPVHETKTKGAPKARPITLRRNNRYHYMGTLYQRGKFYAPAGQLRDHLLSTGFFRVATAIESGEEEAPAPPRRRARRAAPVAPIAVPMPGTSAEGGATAKGRAKATGDPSTDGAASV